MQLMYLYFIKPFFDFVLSCLLLLILSPVLLVLLILLCISNHGKVFFIQERPGYKQKKIHVIKFKTMNDHRDATGKLLPDSERLTPIGRFIRSTSLDEIPQLLNVLKGEMSLVGPRPLLTKYLPLYTPRQARRHEVKPGITGWAQVNGRNALSWEERFALDVWYVDNLSFALDLKILWMTLVKVLRREGITSRTSATMEAFKGSNL